MLKPGVRFFLPCQTDRPVEGFGTGNCSRVRTARLEPAKAFRTAERMERQRTGPETVGMAVFAAVGAEPDISRGGSLFFDRTQIGAQFRVLGDPDIPVLERRAEGISQCLLDRTRKLDPFHAVTAEPVGGAFRLNEAYKMSATLISISPLALLYVFVQRKFIQGIENTGITGE